jgi:hypothetical protein
MSSPGRGSLAMSRGSLYGGGGSGTGGSGVNSYIDLENRPDDIIDTTVSPATTTGGEFTPNNDNDNKAINIYGKVYTTVCCARCVCRS